MQYLWCQRMELSGENEVGYTVVIRRQKICLGSTIACSAMWGVIAVGFSANGRLMNIVGFNGEHQGLFYELASDDTDGNLSWLLICVASFLLFGSRPSWVPLSCLVFGRKKRSDCVFRIIVEPPTNSMVPFAESQRSQFSRSPVHVCHFSCPNKGRRPR